MRRGIVKPQVDSIFLLSPAENRYFVDLRLGEVTLPSLIDTGATHSYLGDEGLSLLESLQLSVAKINSYQVTLANGVEETVQFTVAFVARVHGRDECVTFSLLPNLSVPCLLGLDALKKWGMVLDTSNATWWFKDCPGNIYSFSSPTEGRSGKSTHPVGQVGLKRINADEYRKLEQFLNQEKVVDSSVPGITTLTEHVIDVGNNKPIKQRAYPVSPALQKVINQEVDRMLEEDIIEPSNSPWSSPVVLVKKTNGDYRFCVDFRKVNSLTKKDVYPLPHMSGLLDQLRSCRYLSKIDLAQAYHQIPLAPQSREITAFIVLGRGLFQFKRLPYGLCGAPATFQRLLDRIITPELAPACFAYLDDIIIATDTFGDHVHYLKLVFARLREAGLRVNFDKCTFGCSEMRYLGFVVNEQGLQVDPEKIEPLLKFPTPQNVTELRRFIGLASWYRRFISDFSCRIRPLTQLLRKGQRWIWTAEQEAALQEIKTLLTSAPILARPDFSRTFLLQTDASAEGLGAVLTQDTDNLERVIAYASRALQGAERNYSVTEKECLAVLWAIKKFRQYLEGYHFKVITDHASLKWLHNLKNPTGRLARWALELQGYDFEVIYRRGSAHAVPDFFSRLPSRSLESDQEDNPVSLASCMNVSSDLWYQNKLQSVQQQPGNHPDWKVVDGQLFRHVLEDIELTLEDVSRAWKLVVPEEDQLKVIQENHDLPEAGHLGFEKTLEKVKRHYNWPGMRRDIARYIRKCRVCQTTKPEQRPSVGKMNLKKYTQPWDTVAVDIQGPFPRSSNGFSYLLVFLDTFSKWTEIIPIRLANAKTVAKNFRQFIIFRWGTPRILHSDNGTPFINKIMQGLADTFGITLTQTPPYWPQANPVERTNRVIKTMISSYVEGNHKQWDCYIPEFMFAINTSWHSSLGCTPAYLNFGRELEAPNTHFRKSSPSRLSPLTTSIWTGHLEKLKELRLLAEKNLSEASTKQGHYYNLRRRAPQFKEGDLVLRRAHHLSSGAEGFAAKLALKFEGPFRIATKESCNVFQLQDEDGNDVGPCHAGQMKLYHR